MADLESINKIDLSSENIPKIFESQRKNLKQDILFLKEDILKDFREIESKLNLNYEKQNTKTLTQLNKFENTIEAMNHKILELSSLISTDKNIRNKILILDEFKIKTSDKLYSQELALKSYDSKLKDIVDKYDKILNDSIFYQGLIGTNAKFRNFHQLIDYLLLNINKFVNFKEKDMLDYKGYKTKLENLFRAFKVQADSIITSNNKHTNKKINETEKKFNELLNVQEKRINDINCENNKYKEDLDNKIKQIKSEIKNILDFKKEINDKLKEEIDLLKNFNKGISIKVENNENKIKILKDKCLYLEECIKYIKIEGENKELIINNENNFYSNLNDFNNNNFNPTINNYFGMNSAAKSIIKKYINGEINIKEFGIKRKNTSFINNNKIKNIISNKLHSSLYNNYSLDYISKQKRMTLGPDKLKNFYILNKTLINKTRTFKPINSEKKIVCKNNNSIREEKNEDIDYLQSFRDNNNKSNDLNKEDKKYNSSKEEKDDGEKNNEINEINNDKKIDENFLNYYKKKIEINSGAQTAKTIKENINQKEKEITNYIINKNFKPINTRRNITTMSFKKGDLEKNNSNSKLWNSIDNTKYRINNQKQRILSGNLRKIGGGDNIIQYNNINTSRFKKTNNLFNDNLINDSNSMNYKNKLNKSKSKLNIIEMNFDEPKKSVNKEEDELKTLIKKIKENRMNILSERKNKSISHKRLEINQMNEYNEDFENNSINGDSMKKNLNRYYFSNNVFKNDLKNNGYLKYIKNDKKLSKKRKGNLNKKKGKYGIFFD